MRLPAARCRQPAGPLALTPRGMHLLIGFPAPIVLAQLLNEIRIAGLKRSVQTITYLPHFLSWVVAGGSWSRRCPRTAASSPWCRCC